MTPDKLKAAWQKYTEQNDFILNPKDSHVNQIIVGVLELEKQHGLKLCPCRLRDNSFKRDLDLICPCNFKIQETWYKKGECWCGLFVKK